MNKIVRHLAAIRLPDDDDAQGYLRAQFERGGVDREGAQRMGKIGEYAERARDAAWRLLHVTDPGKRTELRERIVDAVSKEETARELFANGVVQPSLVRARVDQRLRAMIGDGLTAQDQATFEGGYRVIDAYVHKRGAIKNGTGLPKPRAQRDL